MRSAVAHVLNHVCFTLGFAVTNRHFPLAQQKKEKPTSAPHDRPAESCNSEELSPCLFLAVQIDWIAPLDFSHFEGCPAAPLSHLLPARLWPTCSPAEGCRKRAGDIPKITQQRFLRPWPVITRQEAWEAVPGQQAPTQGIGRSGYWQAGGIDVPVLPPPQYLPHQDVQFGPSSSLQPFSAHFLSFWPSYFQERAEHRFVRISTIFWGQNC